MAFYIRVKDPNTSKYKFVQVEETKFSEDTLTPPPSAIVEKRGYTCSLCGKKFLTPGVAAMHFNRMHKDKVQSKDTWREYMTIEPVRV